MRTVLLVVVAAGCSGRAAHLDIHVLDASSRRPIEHAQVDVTGVFSQCRDSINDSAYDYRTVVTDGEGRARADFSGFVEARDCVGSTAAAVGGARYEINIAASGYQETVSLAPVEATKFVTSHVEVLSQCVGSFPTGDGECVTADMPQNALTDADLSVLVVDRNREPINGALVEILDRGAPGPLFETPALLSDTTGPLGWTVFDVPEELVLRLTLLTPNVDTSRLDRNVLVRVTFTGLKQIRGVCEWQPDLPCRFEMFECGPFVSPSICSDFAFPGTCADILDCGDF